jgi:hypothetical protein
MPTIASPSHSWRTSPVKRTVCNAQIETSNVTSSQNVIFKRHCAGFPGSRVAAMIADAPALIKAWTQDAEWMKTMPHTSAGRTLTDLVLEVFRLNGRLLAAGDRLSKTVGLTSARWQVLGA